MDELDDCNELPLPKELDQQPDVSLTQRESMYSDIADSLTQYEIEDNDNASESEETKPPIKNDVCNKQDDDHEVDDDYDALNEHTVGSEDEDEDDREIDASNHSIGSWGMSNINELQPPLSDAQIAESVWNVVAAADRDDNNVHDDKQLAAKIKKYGETKATIEDEDSNSNNGTNSQSNSATSDVQNDIESQQHGQSNANPKRQSSVSWAERVDEYLNETLTEDEEECEEEVGLSGLQRIRSIASNMLSLRSIPITNSTSRRSSVIQAVVTRRPRSRSMVEAHSSRSNESTSSRRNSAPCASATRNTTIRDRFGSIVRGQRRHNPLARSSSANNQALHYLSEMMGEITAVEAYAVVDESHRHTESVEAIPVDMQRERKWRRLKRQIYLIWGPLLLVLVVVVVVAVVNGPGSKTVEVQQDLVVDYDDPTIQLKDGSLSCVDKVLCKAIAAAILGPEYEGNVVEVDVTLHLQEGER